MLKMKHAQKAIIQQNPSLRSTLALLKILAIINKFRKFCAVTDVGTPLEVHEKIIFTGRNRV